MSVATLLAAIKLYVSTCHPVVASCTYLDDVSYYQCQTTLAQQRIDCKKADLALVAFATQK